MIPDPRPQALPSAPEWWRGACLYQVYPRSFQDTNGDGIGDLPGISARLDYLAGLGVDALWISPFFTSPMKDFGYDVADFRGVDPIFGTLADFDRLVERAHGLGLRVVIDQVLSHSSDEHPWFQESRCSRDNAKADWYVWADARPDGTPPNNWQSVFGGSAWGWEPRRRQYYLHNFLASQPDLNFHAPEVQEQMLEAVRFWLERGVDGFRFDACNFHFHDRLLRNNPPASARDRRQATSVIQSNPYAFQRHKYDKSQPENLAFLRRLRQLLDGHGAMSLGEVGDEDPEAVMAAYTGGGDKLHMAYSFKLLSETFSAGFLRRALTRFQRLATAGGGWGCWCFSNHDTMRVATRWARGGDPRAFAKAMVALLATLGGSFCLYQGEELGLTQAEVPFERLVDPYGIAFWPDFKGRDGCRTPMPWTGEAPWGGFSRVEPWLPMPAEHLALAVAGQQEDPDSVLAFVRGFMAWRRRHAALVRGEVVFHRSAEPLFTFTRVLGAQRVFAAFNLSPEPALCTLPARVRPLSGHGLATVQAQPLPGHGLATVQAPPLPGPGQAPAPIQGRRLQLPPWGGFFGIQES
jgi:alpha-glucosidase